MARLCSEHSCVVRGSNTHDIFPFLFMFCSFALVKEAKKPSFTRLDKRTNEEVNTQTKMLCDVSEIDVFQYSTCWIL